MACPAARPHAQPPLQPFVRQPGTTGPRRSPATDWERERTAECSNESDLARADLRSRAGTLSRWMLRYSQFPGVAPERPSRARGAIPPSLEHSTVEKMIAGWQIEQRRESSRHSSPESDSLQPVTGATLGVGDGHHENVIVFVLKDHGIGESRPGQSHLELCRTRGDTSCMRA